MGLLSVLSIDHNRKLSKTIIKFTTRDRHEHLSRSDGVWIKKDESWAVATTACERGSGRGKRGEERREEPKRENE